MWVLTHAGSFTQGLPSSRYPARGVVQRPVHHRDKLGGVVTSRGDFGARDASWRQVAFFAPAKNVAESLRDWSTLRFLNRRQRLDSTPQTTRREGTGPPEPRATNGPRFSRDLTNIRTRQDAWNPHPPFIAAQQELKPSRRVVRMRTPFHLESRNVAFRSGERTRA